MKVTIEIDGPDHWRLMGIAETEGVTSADVYRQGLAVALGDRALARECARLRAEIRALTAIRESLAGELPTETEHRAVAMSALGVPDRLVVEATGLDRTRVAGLRRRAGIKATKEKR